MSEPLPLWKYVVAGGLAGVAEISVMYPTDVLKTRAQLSPVRLSLVQSFKQVVSSQGVTGLYRGVLSPILAEAPKRAWKFSSNEKFKQLLLAEGERSLSPFKAAIAGGLSGVTEAFVNCPFETVKVRMQSPEFVSKFTTTLQCFIYLVRNEGMLSVYKGLEAQMLRNGVWNGAYFGILGWHSSRKTTVRSQQSIRKPSRTEVLFEKFYVGGFASCVGTILNTPFDVVKSRMQNQASLTLEMAGADGVAAKHTVLKYRNSFQSLQLIRAEEGVGALYKGLSARLLRLGPGGGIMIVAFELLTDLLKPF